MASKRTTRAKGTTKGKGKSNANDIPDVYREMLSEELLNQPELPPRPLKKRKVGGRDKGRAIEAKVSSDDEDDDIEFEDVLGEEAGPSSPPKAVQTVERDSGDDSEASDFRWDALDMDDDDDQVAEPSGDLELTLSRPTPSSSRTKLAPRRKAITKLERNLRLEVHKMHVLCLLSHLERRNEWCNDSETQSSLKPLLNSKMLQYLRPKSNLPQFGYAEALKRGLDLVSSMWMRKFRITARGLRRALWADDENDVQNYKLADDTDHSFEKEDFRSAAEKLEGSRDLGIQLFCALLRGAGVEVRLVCSLQPLSFNTGGPSMPKGAPSRQKVETPEASDTEEAIDIGSATSPFAAGSSIPGMPVAPRRRLGHPNAADYHLPKSSAPMTPPPKQKSKTIHESPYPVYWVEVFDKAHQKWFPVDPLVSQSVAKPNKFEPPAADRENNMSYVIAFEDTGYARDVTQRYTKAYNAKTRRNRVESTAGGAKWWRKTVRAYSRSWVSDADQIEDTELAAMVAKEPMPKNIQDFKDHPYYALERHLKRNEVLIKTRGEVGKVAAGRDNKVPGGKKQESIYRRRDVKIARSADAWYRLGRDVKMGEQPIKVSEPKANEDDGGDMDDRPGTNLYSEDQTELYQAPPVVNGRVPKNSFGNLDLFVPSMVPRGGVHLPYDEASRAARLLGIDYSDALTGFEFRGRHGTAVLKGIVVATEYKEAVEAVIEGYRDEQARAEEQMRTIAALTKWKHFLMALRIKQRVDAYEVEGEEPDFIPEPEEDDSGMETEEYDMDEAGGFFPE